MIKLKAGGIILGGVAGYWLLSKGISTLDRIVQHICDARNWHNYYKYNKDGTMVPPGYSQTVTQEENGQNTEIRNKNEKEDLKESLKNSVLKRVDERFTANSQEGVETQEEPKEGQTEAFCEDNCEDIQQEHLTAEKFTEFDGGGRPIAGRYPWTWERDEKGDDANENVD